MNKKERFEAAFNYLRANKIAKSQKAIAVAMEASESNVSVALKYGDPRVLTDQFLMRFVKAFPNIFSLDWLLTGEGDMLLDYAKVTPVHGIDNTTLLNVTISAKDETIEALKREIQTKDDLIESLRAQIEEKNDHITTLKERLVEYRKIIDSHNGFDFPYPFRASEKPEKRQINK